MRIGLVARNQFKNSEDQWCSARCEARTMINAGFGFGEMGHEVSIFCAAFETKQDVWKNVSLFKGWDDSKHYDLLVGFNPGFDGSFGYGARIGNNYSKLFYVYYGAPTPNIPEKRIIEKYHKTVAICSASLDGDELNNACEWDETLGRNKPGAPFDHLRPLEFFPQLFPIPCYDKLTKQDFQDYHFDKTKKKLKIWTILSHWNIGSQNFLPDIAVVNVLRILRDKLKYEIDLTVTVHSEQAMKKQKQEIFVEEFNAKVIKNLSLTYKDLLDLISDMDICIVRGNLGNPNNSSTDILSLGVPMIYIVRGLSFPGDYTLNPIMKHCRDDCINFLLDTPDVQLSKISKQMEDPRPSYERMRFARNRERFPNWKKHMNKLLDKYCGEKILENK